MPSFFTLQDNLLTIIKDVLPHLDTASVQHIKTGWTNIVVEATAGKKSYFFRFPRNEFFAKMMLKDHAFCTFIQGKTSFKTPYLQLFFHDGRPFSMHEKIKGWSLSQRFSHLSRQMMTNIAMDISKFITEISAIPVETLPQKCDMPVSAFLDELSTVDDDYYDLSKHDPLRAFEKSLHVVHGDLNPGNILLDENDRVTAVLDFCFSGTSHRYVDLSRIIGRAPKEFSDIMIAEYQRTTGQNVDPTKVDELIGVWNYVEQQYISYMKRCHPEIQLPEGV